MSSGILYIIATPIGNLDDFSKRAASMLAEVDVIICEDTRHTRGLLQRYNIRRPLEAYHDFNETPKAEALVERLRSGQNFALVSDAGTPTVSDPGYRLVRLCRQQDIPVVPIPGPSATIAALSVSGLPTDDFWFTGFLPSRQAARRRRIESLKRVDCTLIFYEAPRRMRSALQDMREILGDREVFVGREMTKLHEEYVFGKISEVIDQIREQGEAVVVLQGAAPAESTPDAVDLKAISRQELLKITAQRLGVSRKQLYEALYQKER